MITKFSDFLLQEGFAPSPSYNNTVTNPISGKQEDPHNWVGNKCLSCGVTRKLSYNVGYQKFYKYYDQMGLQTRGMQNCYSGSKEYLPKSGKPMKISKTGDELSMNPLPKNTSLWNLKKLQNTPTGFMRAKPEDLSDYIKNKKEFNLSYEYLLDLEQSEQDDLAETERDLAFIRKYLLRKYENDKDWVELIKSVD